MSYAPARFAAKLRTLQPIALRRKRGNDTGHVRYRTFEGLSPFAYDAMRTRIPREPVRMFLGRGKAVNARDVVEHRGMRQAHNALTRI